MTDRRDRVHMEMFGLWREKIEEGVSRGVNGKEGVGRRLREGDREKRQGDVWRGKVEEEVEGLMIGRV